MISEADVLNTKI